MLEISFEQEHAFDEDERKFLSAIASQTALALDRAKLHEEQHHIAHVLQRSLLPQKLPSVPGIEVATSYHALGRERDRRRLLRPLARSTGGTSSSSATSAATARRRRR